MGGDEADAISRRGRQRDGRPANLDRLIRMGGVHRDREVATDAVTVPGTHADGRRDQVGARQVAQRVPVDELAASTMPQ